MERRRRRRRTVVVSDAPLPWNGAPRYGHEEQVVWVGWVQGRIFRRSAGLRMIRHNFASRSIQLRVTRDIKPAQGGEGERGSPHTVVQPGVGVGAEDPAFDLSNTKEKFPPSFRPAVTMVLTHRTGENSQKNSPVCCVFVLCCPCRRTARPPPPSAPFPPLA